MGVVGDIEVVDLIMTVFLLVLVTVMIDIDEFSIPLDVVIDEGKGFTKSDIMSLVDFFFDRYLSTAIFFTGSLI